MSALILVFTRDQALNKSLAKSRARAKEVALAVVFVELHWAWQFHSPALRVS
jgi:hypothetical protein